MKRLYQSNLDLSMTKTSNNIKKMLKVSKSMSFESKQLKKINKKVNVNSSYMSIIKNIEFSKMKLIG